MEEEGARGGSLKGPGKVHGKGILMVGPARACIGSFLLFPKGKNGLQDFCRYSTIYLSFLHALGLCGAVSAGEENHQN